MCHSIPFPWLRGTVNPLPSRPPPTRDFFLSDRLSNVRSSHTESLVPAIGNGEERGRICRITAESRRSVVFKATGGSLCSRQEKKE